MKRNVVVKILLDISMIVLYLLLMFAQSFGSLFHETFGIIIAVLFLIHILLNLSMTKGLIISVKNGKANIIRLLLSISDFILVLCMPLVIISGVLIAKELFVLPEFLPWQAVFTIHNVLSYVCLAVMIFHILFHAKYLIGVFKKIPSSVKSREMAAGLGRFVMGFAAIAVVYCSVVLFKGTTNSLPVSKSADNINKIETTKGTTSNELYKSLEETTIPFDESSTEIDKNENSQILDDEQSDSITQYEEETTKPSVDDFLSKLFCTGCGRRCSLLTPRCGKGEMQASQAREEYIQTYGEIE